MQGVTPSLDIGLNLWHVLSGHLSHIIMSTSTQSIYEVFEHQKTELLLHLLDGLPDFNKVMIFLRTLDEVHALTTVLSHAGVSVESFHGRKKPELRDRALKAFNEGKIRVIVTTEAAARVIDLTGVCNVINYDFPELDQDYLQRVELTGHAGGEVITMVTPQGVNLLSKLESLVGAELPRRVADGFVYASQAVQVKPPRKKGGTSKGLHSKPLQNKKPKYKHKRGR
jgi:ATP-dependent RNA helicase RhlE